MNLFKKPNDRDLKVFIVDDEEYYSSLTKVNLNKLGITDIKIFNNGEECLLEMINNTPDCVILDYLLVGGMNGEEILKRIKKDFKNVEVIILSGQEDVGIASDIMREGASDYIVKNNMSLFNLGNILKKLKIIINSKELQKWSERRLKLTYLLSIIVVWVLGVVYFIFLKK